MSDLDIYQTVLRFYSTNEVPALRYVLKNQYDFEKFDKAFNALK